MSLSAVLTRNIKPHLFLLYVIAQIGGAILGATWLIALLPSTAGPVGVFEPHGITKGQAFAWETLGTMFFILVIQSVALRFTSFSNPDVDITAADSLGGPGGLIIGFSLAGIAWSLAQYTSASLNIARTIASPIIFDGPSHWTVGLFVLAELAGTLLASLIAGVVYGIGSPIVAIIQPGAAENPEERTLNSIQSYVWTGNKINENLRQRTTGGEGTATV